MQVMILSTDSYGFCTGIDGVTGKVINLGYYNGNKNQGTSNSNNASSGSTLKNYVCSGCNGSGKICEDVLLTLGDIYYCSFCGHNGYGKHYQRSCYMCGGKGSYRR